MAKRNYDNWSKEELIREIQKLEKRKKYGIVWEEEKDPEKVVTLCKEKLPVLIEDKSKEIETDKEKPVNILIEGDNYHALSVLNYTHKGSIDVIYIDPPYNTGNNDFRFNDKYIDKQDAYRHSKWLSFLNKRLRLAKSLLKNTGAIFISIDDNELAQLKLLCDEIFGENNLVGLTSIAKGTTTGQDAKKFGSSIDYLLIYGMANFIVGRIELSEKDRKRFSRKDKNGLYSILQWRKTGNGDRRKDRPNLYYAIVGPNGKKVFPKGPTGYESRWRGDLKRFKKLEKENKVEWIKQENEWRPYIKYYLEGRMKAPSNLWNDLEGNKKATIELKEILGEKSFQNPKPTDLIKRCIQLANISDPVILDFFVGSGTTAQAVLDLNYQDDGNRRFIVCTNNENDICSEVCYPRINKVIKGYKNSAGSLVDGTGGNLKYFNTDFVDAKPTDRNKKKLVDKSTEMLCLKEDCFDEVKKGSDFKIFKNSQNKYLGIVYDDDGIEPFKKEAKKMKKKFVVYVFSLDESAREEEFEDVARWVELKPIPAVILNVYKRIFK